MNVHVRLCMQCGRLYNAGGNAILCNAGNVYSKTCHTGSNVYALAVIDFVCRVNAHRKRNWKFLECSRFEFTICCCLKKIILEFKTLSSLMKHNFDEIYRESDQIFPKIWRVEDNLFKIVSLDDWKKLEICTVCKMIAYTHQCCHIFMIFEIEKLRLQHTIQ